jgi:UDP-N-acetylglucosamine 4,6-dehydratase
MKHVPICEYNPIEAVQTNVVGARNLIEAAIANRVGRVLALSTDKAVAPANLYGATKLCMEKLLIAANAYAGELATPVLGRALRQRHGLGRQRDPAVPLAARGRTPDHHRRAHDPVLDPHGRRGGPGPARARPHDRRRGLRAQAADHRHRHAGRGHGPPGCRATRSGIRPGEKLHEVLLSNEEARRAVDVDELIVIWPEFVFHHARERSRGRALPEDFVYSSDRAGPRLDVDATRALLAMIDEPAVPPASPGAGGLIAPRWLLRRRRETNRHGGGHVLRLAALARGRGRGRRRRPPGGRRQPGGQRGGVDPRAAWPRPRSRRPPRAPTTSTPPSGRRAPWPRPR